MCKYSEHLKRAPLTLTPCSHNPQVKSRIRRKKRRNQHEGGMKIRRKTSRIQEHDEDPHDLHRHFPEIFQCIQKHESSMAFQRSIIRHQRTTINTSKNHESSMNSSKYKSSVKLKIDRSPSF